MKWLDRLLGLFLPERQTLIVFGEAPTDTTTDLANLLVNIRCHVPVTSPAPRQATEIDWLIPFTRQEKA